MVDAASDQRLAIADLSGDGGRIAVGGLLVGRYRLIARIGAGGMATIYRARDESLDRDVAVKVLHAHLADDPALLGRFRSEARAAAALLHPNIVNVFDQGVAELPFIVLEYVDGPSLREVLIDRGRLTPGETLAVVEPICAALSRAHGAGLVHRDVKPENVLVASDGTVKVADFGIARAVVGTGFTQTGALVGSVHYLAPELVGGANASPATDQYALGVLIFETLTGRKPLPADSPMAIALRHAREPIPLPSSMAPDVGRDLDRVVSRATAGDPRRRFPDLGALVVALHAAVPGGAKPVVVRAPAAAPEHTLIIPPDAQDTWHAGAAPHAAERGYLPELDQPKPRVRRRRRHPRRESPRQRLAATLTVVLLLLGGGGFLVWDQVLAPVRQIPELIGRSQADAAEALEELGLQLDLTDSTSSVAVPEGAVAAQEPGPGAALRKGGSVTIALSSGPAAVTMPEVFELPRDEAVALLQGEPYLFNVRVDEDWGPVPIGLVQAQAPPAEEPLRQGADVIVNISRGIEQVVVPDLVGLPRPEAEALLAENKLVGAFVEEYSDEQPTVDVVLGQSIPAATELDRDSTVEVVVSGGPVTFKAPNLRGRGISAARAALAEEGLEAVVHGVPRPRIGPFRRGEYGLVEEQAPAPGQTVRRGDTIDLYTFTEEADAAAG